MSFKYADITFHACHDELFAIEGSYWQSELKGNEIVELANILNIEVNRDTITNAYGKIDCIEIFHSKDDHETFLYFDLIKDNTDQNDMLFFGIRFQRENFDQVLYPILDIYNKLKTTSPLKYDKWGYSLFAFGKYAFERKEIEPFIVNHYTI